MILVYDYFGKPVVRSVEPGLARTDRPPSEFEVGALTPEQEVEKKKSQSKRVLKSPLMAVLESWLLFILHCRFLIRSVASFSSFCR